MIREMGGGFLMQRPSVEVVGEECLNDRGSDSNGSRDGIQNHDGKRIEPAERDSTRNIQVVCVTANCRPIPHLKPEF